ncbi:MAG: hypothetical protein FWG98_12725 [Candidatus Cloacimonetes bacterium]|nr:hypothetical protein [Candidatus Cloacimonadota bacterium]
MKDMILIFPPAHDFTMPYSAMGIIKAYIENQSKMSIEILDLNLAFYTNLIQESNLQEYIRISQDFIERNDLTGIIKYIILFNSKINEVLSHLDNSDKYKLSKRKISATSFDTLHLNDILKESEKADDSIMNLLIKNLDFEKISKAKYVGINISVEDQVLCALFIAIILKKQFPEKPIVMGGNIVSRIPDKFENLRNLKIIDYIIEGEGELQLLNLFNGQPFSRSDFLQNINLIKRGLYETYSPNLYLSVFPVIPILTSRKCSWNKCDFCSIHSSWTKYRNRSIDEVITEIEYYKNLGYKYFRIIDENFQIKRMISFAKKIINLGWDNLRFEAYTRFEKDFLNSETATLLYQAGFRQFFWGLESIGEKTINLVGKTNQFDKNNISEILKNTANAGILNYVFVLVGIPNSYINDEITTVDYIVSNNDIHSVALGSFVVDCYSPIHLNNNVRKKYNITLLDEPLRLSTEIPYLSDSEWSKDVIQKRAEEYTKKIYKARKDLALSSSLNEEERFILSDYFGNNFCKKISEDDTLNECVNVAINNSVKHKIKRGL